MPEAPTDKPKANLFDRRQLNALLRDLLTRLNDCTLPEAETLFINLRNIADEVGRRLQERRGAELAETCFICHRPFVQGIPWRRENFLNERMELVPRYACSPLCEGQLEKLAMEQGHTSRPGNMFPPQR
jgi:hypothetical protein